MRLNNSNKNKILITLLNLLWKKQMKRLNLLFLKNCDGRDWWISGQNFLTLFWENQNVWNFRKIWMGTKGREEVKRGRRIGGTELNRLIIGNNIWTVHTCYWLNYWHSCANKVPAVLRLIIVLIPKQNLLMSPVSPVFHTVATVKKRKCSLYVIIIALWLNEIWNEISDKK